MKLIVVICAFLFTITIQSQAIRVASSGVSDIDKIFESDDITIEVRYYGGINPGVISKNVMKIFPKDDGKFLLSLNNGTQNSNSIILNSSLKTELKLIFKDLLLDHFHSQVLLGSCTNFDKIYVLSGNDKTMEIIPSEFSPRCNSLENWFQKMLN